VSRDAVDQRSLVTDQKSWNIRSQAFWYYHTGC